MEYSDDFLQKFVELLEIAKNKYPGPYPSDEWRIALLEEVHEVTQEPFGSEREAEECMDVAIVAYRIAEAYYRKSKEIDLNVQ